MKQKMCSRIAKTIKSGHLWQHLYIIFMAAYDKGALIVHHMFTKVNIARPFWRSMKKPNEPASEKISSLYSLQQIRGRIFNFNTLFLKPNKRRSYPTAIVQHHFHHQQGETEWQLKHNHSTPHHTPPYHPHRVTTIINNQQTSNNSTARILYANYTKPENTYVINFEWRGNGVAVKKISELAQLGAG